VIVDNYPNGTLLKGSGPAIYVMSGGLKRHMPNMETFEVRRYDWSRIFTLPDSVVDSIPTGRTLPSALADGNMFMGSGPQVYVMQGGTKRHVLSEAVFTACGYGWDAVGGLSDSTLATIPTGAAISGEPCPRFLPSDGALVRGSGPAVYLMKGGVKRHVPSPATFETLRYRWGDLDGLVDSQLSRIPTGTPLLDMLTSGLLLKGSGPEVYVMQGGVRRHIVDGDVLAACGYSWSAIYYPPDSSLNSIPTGSPLTGSPCPVFSPPTGRLLKGAGPEVFFVQSGLRRHIPNAQTLTARGFRYSNIDFVHDSYLDDIPAGRPIFDVLTDGNLLKGPGPQVYVMQGGRRRHIISETVLGTCSYSWNAVRAISDADIASIAMGDPLSTTPCPALQPPTGALFKGSGPEVYTAESGQRRHITSESTFASCGYHWGNVDWLRDAEIAEIAVAARSDTSCHRATRTVRAEPVPARLFFAADILTSEAKRPRMTFSHRNRG
jgi:hypothetical protein